MEAYAMEWMEAVTASMDGLVPTVKLKRNQRSANQTPARMEAYAMEWMEAVTA